MWSTSVIIDQSIAALLFVCLLGGAFEVSETSVGEPLLPAATTFTGPAALEVQPALPIRSRLTESAWAAPRPAPVTTAVVSPTLTAATRDDEHHQPRESTEQQPAAAALEQPAVSTTPTPTPALRTPQAEAADLAAIEDLIKQIEFELDSLESFDPLAVSAASTLP